MKTLSFAGLFLFLLFAVPVLQAEEAAAPPTLEQLEVLRKELKEVSGRLEKALTERRDFLESELRNGEKTLEAASNKIERKKIIDTQRALRVERDALNDEIRTINAGDVVKFSNGRNRILSFFSHQTRV